MKDRQLKLQENGTNICLQQAAGNSSCNKIMSLPLFISFSIKSCLINEANSRTLLRSKCSFVCTCGTVNANFQPVISGTLTRVWEVCRQAQVQRTKIHNENIYLPVKTFPMCINFFQFPLYYSWSGFKYWWCFSLCTPIVRNLRCFRLTSKNLVYDIIWWSCNSFFHIY